MSSYGLFARYYDALTTDISYPARAAYFHGLIHKHLAKPLSEPVLDLACGTGSLTVALAALGFDMIGVDSSADMLAVAMGKPTQSENPILFLRQRMEQLDLFGTIDACVCALDSLNHLPGPEALEKAISRVSLFLSPGGVFVFDMNTPYKHQAVLGDNTFVYEHGSMLCLWRNAYSAVAHKAGPLHKVDISLDFFEKEKDGRYRRTGEAFAEYAYDTAAVENMLAACGLTLVAVYAADTTAPPAADTQRLVYVATKQ